MKTNEAARIALAVFALSVCLCPRPSARALAGAPTLKVSIAVRETGATGSLGSNGGTSGAIEWLDLDGQDLILDGVWRQHTWSVDAAVATAFTGNGALDGVGGALEHLRLKSTGTAGPFNIFIDDFEISTPAPASFTEDFEGFTPGAEVLFRPPSFSATTSGFLSPGSSSGIAGLPSRSIARIRPTGCACRRSTPPTCRTQRSRSAPEQW
jgi:hypothetical protein